MRLAIAVLGLASCYAPTLDRCAVRCEGDEPCPGGMVCNADRFCHDPADGEACDPASFAVTVNRGGQGAGRIVGRNLDCASMAPECTASATEGSYEISAVADPDSRVLSWAIDGVVRDDCATLDRCTFDLVKDTNVDVTFGAGRTLTLNVAGRGANVVVSSQDGKISCKLASGTCTQGYDLGTSVTLEAAPGAPRFRGWTGCIGASGTSCTVVLDDNKTVTASFDILQVQIIGAPTYGGGLTLSGQPACVNQNCTYELDPGTPTLSVLASPSATFELDRWVNTPCENQTPAPNPCTFTAFSDQLVIGLFTEAPTVRVIPPPSTSGTIAMSGTFKGMSVNQVCTDAMAGCTLHFDSGSFVTLTEMPKAGHAFVKWMTCPNTGQESNPTCRFPIPKGTHVSLTPQFQ